MKLIKKILLKILEKWDWFLYEFDREKGSRPPKDKP